jgi:hypothetical protein
MEPSKELRAWALDVPPDDEEQFLCPYRGCSRSFEDADSRRRHMRRDHAEETKERFEGLARKIAEGWKSRAACAGYEMVFETTSKSKIAQEAGFRPPSPREAAAITLCATCPVRAECAEASVNPPPVVLAGPGLLAQERAHSPWSFEPHGIWAGVRDFERKRVVTELGHGTEAVSALLAIGERMAREYPGDPSKLWVVGDETGTTKKRAKKRPPKKLRFEQGGLPGPGRGHRGPVGDYAAAHGVSRMTAWRKLRKVAA